MENKPLVRMTPWYKGYGGIIEANADSTGYSDSGIFEFLDENVLSITELPVGKWTRDYKTFLEEMIANEEVEDIREHHQENRVDFKV